MNKRKSQISTLNENHPKVITQAEYVFIISIVLGFIINFFLPLRGIPKIIHIPLGVVFIIAGIRVLALSIDRFQKAKTSVSPFKPVKSLVMKGPYKRSRHPMYFGRVLLQMGIGFIFGNIWIVVLVIPTILIIWYGVIIPEEKYLQQRFGNKYLTYKKSTRCWI
tara:strand:+ start:36 stop:527 length:492 start_codon:yes stop_codon:yes gene_type:complete